MAQEWLHSEVPALSGSRPVDLFDTFAGREMVRQVLRKISYGEFS
ncbi:antitoxin Xre/MbcA/ParS toxin-binding domain-containing protein [Vreelandella rituensis]